MKWNIIIDANKSIINGGSCENDIVPTTICDINICEKGHENYCFLSISVIFYSGSIKILWSISLASYIFLLAPFLCKKLNPQFGLMFAGEHAVKLPAWHSKKIHKELNMMTANRNIASFQFSNSVIWYFFTFHVKA